MALSPNYGWAEPDNSSLVKNGAQDIRALGDAIDTSVWNVGYGQAGKNKIINGDFGIWQRGTSFASGISSKYLADRFYYERSSGTYSASRETFTPGTAPVAGYEGQYFLRVSPTVAGDMRIAQYIENVQTFAGQQVTFSFWAKASIATTIQYVLYSQNFGSGGSSAVTNTTGASQAITTSWARYSFTVTMPSISGKTIGTSSYVRFAIDLLESFTGDFDTWGWQLEYGSKATPFQTATGTIQGELAACQRYYYRQAPSAIYGNFGFGNAETTGALSVQLHFPVTMRTAPTVLDTSAMGTFYYQTGGTAGNTPTTITMNANQTTPNIGLLQVNKTTSFTVGAMYFLAANNTATGFLGVSAEL
jgi:hypothetical protein